jgi:amino acid transporter
MRAKKAIGLWSAVAIGVGGMIGAGIFSILGIACQIAGTLVYVPFIIAGTVALFCSYSYAKLGVIYPTAGGPVEFLTAAFGDNVLSGGLNILLWTGYVFALALYARAFGGYAATFISATAVGIWPNVFASAIILVFTLVNFIGAKAVGRSEIFIVGVKVGILIIFAFLGLLYIKPALLVSTNKVSFSSIVFCSGVVFLAYEGFGLITNAAEDMKNVRVLLPRALYVSVIIAMLIYVTVCLAVVGNLPLAQIIKAKDYALAEAARPLLGLVGFKIIAVAALFSTSSAINATLYGGANVSYTVAKKGELPELFERKVWGRSSEGLFITSAVVILFANVLYLDGIAMLGSSTFLIIYTAVSFAHLKVRKKTSASPIVIWLSILGCCFSFVMLIFYAISKAPVTIVVLAIVIIMSFLIEYIYRRYSGRALKVRSAP